MTSRSIRLTGWRRIANAVWGPPADPQIFGALDVDARPALAFIERARAAGAYVTPTHLVGRALGHALAAVPDLNVRIRRGRARSRRSVDVFFITSVAGGRDLSGVKIADVPGRSACAIAAELTERSQAMKHGHDRDFARTKRLMDALPPRLLRAALGLGAMITQELELDVPALGLHRDPFGSGMVSSVGSLGLPRGFAPLASMYDVPILVLVGEVTRQAVVVGDRVEACPILPISVTIDHRYVDGAQIGIALRAFREYLAAPARFEPALPALTGGTRFGATSARC